MSTDTKTPFEVGAPINVPDPPRVPGLRLRHYRGPQDHPGMIRANNVTREEAGIVERVSVEGMDSDYTNLTNSDPYRDVIIAETDAGIVAYGRLEWGDHTDGGRDYTSFCLVGPSVRRRGLGRAMLGWQEARIREVAAGHETDRPRWYFAFVNDGDAGGLALLAVGRLHRCPPRGRDGAATPRRHPGGPAARRGHLPNGVGGRRARGLGGHAPRSSATTGVLPTSPKRATPASSRSQVRPVAVGRCVGGR